MEIHNIKDSLKVEHSNFEKQDMFYRTTFGNWPERVIYEEDPETQRKDIDLYVTNKAGMKLSVSEKFRPKDYGDILFEIFSVWPNKHGWAVESEADLLAYFTPCSVTLLDMQRMKQILVENRITTHIVNSGDSMDYRRFFFYNKEYLLWQVTANNGSYVSVSLAFQPQHLTKLGVNYSVIRFE